jgi:thiosulfate/3-mercaptopyruvate sulfurtransferase
MTLVSADWLREHLDDVVLLDASIVRTDAGFSSGQDLYEAAHLPGARFADLFGGFSDPDAALPFTIPPVVTLRAAAQAAGVRDGAHVVVYDRNGGAWAARIWWLLRVHGFDRVSVLDGGLEAWSGPLVSGLEKAIENGDLTLHEPGPVTAGIDEVADAPAGTVVCALRRESYDAGSVSLPYPELLRADGTLDLPLVRSRAAGLPEDAIAYCGGGINAAGLILALTAAGLPAPRLYDGSLGEWRADPARPIER